MPEGDTVLRTARRLDAALRGRPLTRCDLRWGELATYDASGQTTTEVVSRGKHLLHRLDGGWTIHSHLRMEGSWRVLAAAEATASRLANPQIRAVVAAPDWVCLGLRLGMLDVVRTDDETRVVGHLGPDVLGDDWDEAEALSRIGAAADQLVGSALLDQRNLAGIGTFYAAEALFLEALNPWSPVGDLPPERLRDVVRRARRLLQAGAAHAVPSTTGSRRRGEEAYVHARVGLACRRCGATIRVAPIGPATRERVLFSCPGCQDGRAPTDDGRPQRPLGAHRPRRSTASAGPQPPSTPGRRGTGDGAGYRRRGG